MKDLGAAVIVSFASATVTKQHNPGAWQECTLKVLEAAGQKSRLVGSGFFQGLRKALPRPHPGLEDRQPSSRSHASFSPCTRLSPNFPFS